MSWIQQNANLYTNSDAPFSLQYLNSAWYLIDNRDQSKAISFSDIFNNPVFPIDLSLTDVLVKSLSATNTVSGTHLRSETANTPSTPGHSFKAEISSGLYRESAGVLALSVLGVKIAKFDSFGITASTPYWLIVDSKASGTAAGTFTSGAWRTRDLNTTIGTNTISGSSLSTNQFTLPAGKYRISASAPTYACNNHKAKLRNITDSTDILIGTSEVSNQTFNGATRSFINGLFTITATKTFEIQHQCSSSQNFGQPSSFSVDEIYTIVELWELE